MNKKQYAELLRSIKSNVRKRRKNTKHLTQKVIDLLIKCTLRDDFEEMQGTDLYRYNGGCYCELLEVMSDYAGIIARLKIRYQLSRDIYATL